MTTEFVPRVVIESLCTTYQEKHIEDKKQFLLILAQELHIDATAVSVVSSIE